MRFTPKTRHATHSSWQVTDWQFIFNNPFGDPYRLDKRQPGVGEHTVYMNPQAAKDLGIEDGDYVYGYDDDDIDKDYDSNYEENETDDSYMAANDHGDGNQVSVCCSMGEIITIPFDSSTDDVQDRNRLGSQSQRVKSRTIDFGRWRLNMGGPCCPRPVLRCRCRRSA